ncbi:MAG: hypothetical protein ACXAAO_14115, partial [Candidatus Thorarchaeota archaeon]
DMSLNWTALDRDSVYAMAMMEGTGAMEGVKFWYNTTLYSASDDNLVFDLDRMAAADGSGVPIWMSDDSESFTTPMVTVWLYDKDPATVTDMVDNVRNMLYADIFFIRAEMDRDYLNRYFELQNIQSNNQIYNKYGMIALGAAMIIAAPFTGGASAIWGLDLISASTTGKSMFDHAIHGAARLTNMAGLTNFSDDTIDSFHFMHFTSDKCADLLIQELVANAMGGAVKKVGGRLRGSTRAMQEVAEGAADAIVGKGGILRGVTGNVLGGIQGKITALTRKVSTLGKLAAGVIFIGRAVAEAMFESIFEFSFDAMNAFSEGDRPAGGATGIFWTVMVASQLLSVVGGLHKFDVQLVKQLDGSVVVRMLADTPRYMAYVGKIANMVQILMMISVMPALRGMMM